MFSALSPVAVVEVLILQRFPYGQNSTFFYLAQKELLRIQEGDVVEVPWRNKLIQGVVVKIKKMMLDPAFWQEKKEFDLGWLKTTPSYFFSVLPSEPIKMKEISRIISKQYFKSSTLLTLKKLADEHLVSWNHFVLSAYSTEAKRRCQKKSYLPLMGKWVNSLRNQSSHDSLLKQEVKNIKIEIDYPMLFLAQDQISFLKSSIEKTLQEKKQILVLTGEKSQTLPLAIKYFFLVENFLTSTPLILSKILPSALFKKTWQETKENHPAVFIGNRSAIFAPFVNLGLIIFENGHDVNFKQWDRIPKYDTRKIVGDLFPTANKIYLSSTPRLEDFWQSPFFVEEKENQGTIVKANIHHFLEAKLRDLPTEDALEKSEVYSSKYSFFYQGEQKKIELINLKIVRKLENSVLALGKKIIEKIVAIFQQKKWVVVLAGHQGWANLFICADCGFIPECPTCGKKMAVSAQQILTCPICGFSQPRLSSCPQCQGSNFRFDNFGFEQIQQELQTLATENQVELLVFPNAKASFSQFLLFWEKLINNLEKPVIILGYTGILPTLFLFRKKIGLSTLVSFDNLLFYPDFRSEERIANRFFSLLTISPEVVIQTNFPKHYFLLRLVQNQYASFFPRWLKERKEFNYPPFTQLWELEVNGYNNQEISQKVNRLKINLEKIPAVKEVLFSLRQIIFKGGRGKLSVLVKTDKEFNLFASFAKNEELKKSFFATRL